MSNEIPKKIHYCWFGPNQPDSLVNKCIESWRKYLPDYEIILWNETNFDINMNRYVQEAYKEKKWAFITDYVRLYVLYKYGGIYMDSDVEVIKNLDEFLIHGAFSGFEDIKRIPTGIIGASEKNQWIGYLLSYYDNISFYNSDGSLNLKTNVETITNMSIKKGFDINKEEQVFFDDVHIYPKEYFAPKSHLTGEIVCTENTYTIHHFAGSWIDKGIKDCLRKKAIKIIGEANYIKLSKIKSRVYSINR